MCSCTCVKIVIFTIVKSFHGFMSKYKIFVDARDVSANIAAKIKLFITWGTGEAIVYGLISRSPNVDSVGTVINIPIPLFNLGTHQLHMWFGNINGVFINEYSQCDVSGQDECVVVV